MKRFVCVACLILVFSACSSSAETDSSDTSPSSDQAAAPSVSVEEKEEVKRTPIELYPGGTFQQRYESYHHAYLVAAGDPYADPNFEPLQELSTERMNKSDKEFLEKLEKQGEVLQFPVESPIDEHILSDIGGDAVVVDPNIALFMDCYYSNSYLAKEGSPQKIEAEAETIFYLVEMKFVDGQWRLNGLSEEAYWEGEGECVK